MNKQSSFMDQDFTNAKRKLEYAVQQGLLPPKVEAKLLLLASLIDSSPLPDQCQDLQQFQKDALGCLSRQDCKRLFLDIIKNLNFGHQKGVLMAKRAGLISKWYQTKIQLTSKGFRLRLSNFFDFQRDDVTLGQISNKKKRWVMELSRKNGQKFIIGAEHELTLFNWKNKIQRHFEKEEMKTEIQPNQAPELSDQDQEDSPPDYDSYISDVFGDQEFTLLEMNQTTRILTHKLNKALLKATVWLKTEDLARVLNLLHQQQLWNSCVQSVTVVNKIENLNFVVHQKHKPEGVLSFARDFLFLRTAFKKLDVLYLLDRSVPGESSTASIIRGEFKRRVYAILKHPEENSSLVIILLECDNKGYNTEQSNINRNVTLLKQHANLGEYLRLQKILKKGNESSLFDGVFRVRVQRPFTKKKSKILQGKRQITLSETIPQSPPTIQKSGIEQDIISLVNSNQHHFSPLKTVSLDMQFTPRCVDPGPDHYFLNEQWAVRQGRMIFVDKETIRKQNQVISFLLKRIGSNLLSGKSIMNISFPVKIFDPYSDIERLVWRNSLSVHYFPLAAKATLQRQLGLVQVFQLTRANCCLVMKKPFNPILGETYQAFNKNQEIFVQQISHHPPISAFLHLSSLYRFHGLEQPDVCLGFNTATGQFKGYHTVEFQNGEVITLYYAGFQMKGIMFGDREIAVVGRFLAVNQKRGMLAQSNIGVKYNKQIYLLTPQQKRQLNPSSVVGGVFRVKSQAIARAKLQLHNFVLGKSDLLSEQLLAIRGHTINRIYLGHQQVYSLTSPVPLFIKNSQNPLASDSTFRLDRHFLQKGDEDRAQQEKQRLEQRQRQDRKLRKDAGQISYH